MPILPPQGVIWWACEEYLGKTIATFSSGKDKVLPEKGKILEELFQTRGRSDTAVLQILVMEWQFFPSEYNMGALNNCRYYRIALYFCHHIMYFRPEAAPKFSLGLLHFAGIGFCCTSQYTQEELLVWPLECIHLPLKLDGFSYTKYIPRGHMRT